MRREGRAQPPNALYRAFDEAQFGEGRTLNLRDGLPSGDEAATRAEAWLRLKQVEGAREVLIITGRGAHSVGAVPVVRAHVVKRLARLRRAGVVASTKEHSPGSYIISLAPVSTMLTASQQPQRPRNNQSVSTRATADLSAATRQLVHDLAVRTLASLGIHATTRAIVADEIERQVELLVRAMPKDADREQWIRDATLRVLNDLE
jgi:hypothetical protein